ncbi:MAG: SOS response-associated peptidase [Deltaproteobacteria bacterium]|nr:MAG: SOS response-associated peptidase [Deltaproteobacteria bacterium]
MCGRFAFFSLDPEAFSRFGIDEVPSGLEPRYNIAPSQKAAVIVAVPGRELRLLRWGLVPRWAKDPRIGNRLINARVETLAGKPAFRDAFARRRCLVLADGFYEWKKSNGSKQPYFISLSSGRPFAMAGLWERWEKGTEPLETFTIVTADASGQLAEIHGRMPLVLQGGGADLWLAQGSLDAERLDRLVEESRGLNWVFHPVGTAVNNPANDGPELLRAP